MTGAAAAAKMAVMVLTACLLTAIACDPDPTGDVAAPVSAPDGVERPGVATGAAFPPGDPVHDDQMEALLARPDVAAVVDAYQSLGLRLAPDRSVTLRGGDGERSVWVTLIGFDGGEHPAMIACYGSGERFGLSPVRFATDKPAGEKGWKPFVGSGWYAAPDVGPLPRCQQRWEPFEWWDWGFFGRCIAERAPEASAVCALQCVWVPGYWQCFMVCTASKAVSATIACILQMYQWGGNEIKGED